MTKNTMEEAKKLQSQFNMLEQAWKQSVPQFEEQAKLEMNQGASDLIAFKHRHGITVCISVYSV